MYAFFCRPFASPPSSLPRSPSDVLPYFLFVFFRGREKERSWGVVLRGGCSVIDSPFFISNELGLIDIVVYRT